MKGRLLPDFIADRTAAVAPMYALSLFGLITIAGVGWDYSRMMTMDSELQNAADQAALAAATQLTGTEGAMARARDAATNYLASSDSAYVNQTKLANDGNGQDITGLSFFFYESYDHATDTFGPQVTNDDDAEDALYVRVIVNGRESFFSMTAITGVLSSGLIEADAVATLESALCESPKMFVCAPTRDFPQPGDKGKGLLLRQLPNATDAMAPGNFGFLDVDGGIKSDRDTGNPNRELGKNGVVNSCIASKGIDSEPGFVATETNALNTRFDIYNPPGMPGCNATTGDFCPSQNTVTRYAYEIALNPGQNPATATCPASPPNAAKFVSLDEALAEIDSAGGTRANSNPGYQRDNCMLTGACNAVGDGDWSGDAYMTTNHGVSLLSVTDGTRHGVYEWEKADAANRLTPRRVGYTPATGKPAKGKLFCSYPEPVNEAPLVPSSTQKDRRVMLVAVVDCTDLNGREKLDVLRFADLFLVNASRSSGPNAGEIMTEVIGPGSLPGGGSGFQAVGRKKPVLVR